MGYWYSWSVVNIDYLVNMDDISYISVWLDAELNFLMPGVTIANQAKL